MSLILHIGDRSEEATTLALWYSLRKSSMSFVGELVLFQLLQSTLQHFWGWFENLQNGAQKISVHALCQVVVDNARELFLSHRLRLKRPTSPLQVRRADAQARIECRPGLQMQALQAQGSCAEWYLAPVPW